MVDLQARRSFFNCCANAQEAGLEAKPPLPIVVIACKVFQGFLERYLPDHLTREVIWLDYGLHAVPKNLKSAIQEQIDRIRVPSLIVLGYGLCGNGLHGIQTGIHTILVPRTDDCIAILLGSRQAYQHEFNQCPATYYLSKGWLESGSNPLQEYLGYVEKYGEQQASWIMDQQYRHYKRLALVAHRPEDLEKYRPKAKEVAEYCAQWGMQYVEILGSEEYIRQLAEAAQNLTLAGDDFLIAPPGSELTQSQFLRLR